MIKRIQGIEDVFPDRIPMWKKIENTARTVFRNSNFKELIIPIMEYTEVFSRGLGDDTDIVSKEMYTLTDRGDRSLTLRPEGTASVVRAYVENGEYNRLSLNKFFYVGPMFRAERPQKGRLRQFNQFGAELFGSSSPYHDFEVINLMNSITKDLGIKDYSLLINSIGCKECRPQYLDKLKEYYSQHLEELCEDCNKRYNKNILRLLDCKNKSCQKIRKDAPHITDHLCDECSVHHNELKEYLSDGDIVYKEDPFLVRGLDYYTRTTFEFTTEKLGGQNAFAAGGRYDHLVQQFEGKPTPAVGFAAGMERIFLMLEEDGVSIDQNIDVFIVHGGEGTFKKAFSLAKILRENNFSVDLDPPGKGFKGQFKRADREKALYTIVIGEDELQNNSASIKNMNTGTQKAIAFDAIIEYLNEELVK
jgi:histidyl-tRNA synthetase